VRLVVLFEFSRRSPNIFPSSRSGTEEFFDPTADASCLSTYTKRDLVFARLNVQLQRGTVTLLHQEPGGLRTGECAFMQLEFSDVKLLAESLPRRNSSLLSVRLGGLFLRDLATEGTMFPLLVFPNSVRTAVGWMLRPGWGEL